MESIVGENEERNVKKLSQTIRQKLVEYVYNEANLSQPKTMTDIAHALNIGTSTTSRHLQLMQAQGQLPSNVIVKRVGSAILTMKVN